MKLSELRQIIREEIQRTNEDYNKVGVDFVKNKLDKLGDYKRYDDIKKTNDFTFLHFKEKDPDFYLWGDIKAFDNKDGTEVGNVSYAKQDKNDPLKASVDVRPDMRRKGLATDMYKWVEKLTRERLVPDTPHTKDAQNFWKKFKNR